MANITFKLSDELLQHTRLAAAHRNMTVSELLRAFLTTLEKAPAASAPGLNQTDSHLFNHYFPPQQEKSMGIEIMRLAHQIESRRR
ncbi:hypothetical protein [Terracidiphilus gabretensis]|uniref:hypothetical protein n=1 Tax=Terracidiphilus gabretensis TaxID=1577687 RepID=UPI00071B5F1C|nr:hypothetical protein [Terracidiphilus gabretensis]